MSTDSRFSSPVRLGLVAIAVLGVIATAAWALLNERADDAVAASFGDNELTVGELNDILTSNPDAQTATGDAPAAGASTRAADEITGWLIVEAVDDELAARGAAADDSHEAEALTLFVDAPDVDVESPFGQQLLRLQTVLAALREYADESTRGEPVDVEPPEYLCASHVLVETEADALAVIEELDAGLDFAAAAIEFSTGPSGPTGGDLGCADTAGYVPEFADGARANGAGVTPPVQSQFGWHVIQVRSIGPLSVENHPEMDVEVVETTLINAEAGAREAAAGAAFDEVVAAGRARVDADVDIDPRYGTWDAETGAVTPSAGVAG